MKRQYVNLTLMICLIILCSSFIVSADNSQQIVLTLEDAQKRALENSLEYSQQDDNINDSLENYYDTEESNDKSYSSASKGFYEYFMKPVNLETSLQSAVNSVKAERLKKENIKRTSDYNVMKAFVNIKKAQYALEDAKLDTNAKSMGYEAAKVKYSLALMKKTELKQAETAYSSASDTEAEALNSLQKEYQTLNRYLGRELTDYNLQLVMDLPLVDIASIDLVKLREDYIAKSESLNSLELKAELAKKKYETTKERYDEFVVRLSVQNSRDEMEKAFDDATREYENARKAFDDATIDLDMTLSSNFEALKSKSDSIVDLKEEIESSKSEAEKAKIQYDMSLISKTSMDNAIIKLETLENKLQSSLADLNLQYSSLMMYSE